MLRKMHSVCLILEYFPPKPGSFKILPPPPKNNNVEVWPKHFCSRLNNIDQGRVGGGITTVSNSRGGSAVSKKVQNSQRFFCEIVAAILVLAARVLVEVEGHSLLAARFSVNVSRTDILSVIRT